MVPPPLAGHERHSREKEDGGHLAAHRALPSPEPRCGVGPDSGLRPVPASLAHKVPGQRDEARRHRGDHPRLVHQREVGPLLPLGACQDEVPAVIYKCQCAQMIAALPFEL